MKKRLLIVCGDCSLCSSLRTRLANANLSYSEVATGSAGILLIEKSEIEVALIDNSIPDVSGLDLIGIITRLKPDIKIIFVNRQNEPEVEMGARQLGLVYYTTSLDDSRIVEVVSRINNGQEPSSLVATP